MLLQFLLTGFLKKFRFRSTETSMFKKFPQVSRISMCSCLREYTRTPQTYTPCRDSTECQRRLLFSLQVHVRAGSRLHPSPSYSARTHRLRWVPPPWRQRSSWRWWAQRSQYQRCPAKEQHSHMNPHIDAAYPPLTCAWPTSNTALFENPGEVSKVRFGSCTPEAAKNGMPWWAELPEREVVPWETQKPHNAPLAGFHEQHSCRSNKCSINYLLRRHLNRVWTAESVLTKSE